MELLPDDLKARLPPLLSQEADEEPVVYAKFTLPGAMTAWYVIEGESQGDDFLFYGFVTQPENQFAHFELSRLESLHAERDPEFREGRLTDVVPAPDL